MRRTPDGAALADEPGHADWDTVVKRQGAGRLCPMARAGPGLRQGRLAGSPDRSSAANTANHSRPVWPVIRTARPARPARDQAGLPCPTGP